jgi:hypothetical protein
MDLLTGMNDGPFWYRFSENIKNKFIIADAILSVNPIFVFSIYNLA